MVTSVTNSVQAILPAQDSQAQGQRVDLSLRREVAVTAKFGPDPFTGSPLQIISGQDVQAAETNDLIRLAQTNINPVVSPSNSFQAQSAGSQELTGDGTTAGNGNKRAAQQDGSLNQDALNFGVGLAGGQRGLSLDFEV